MKVLVAMSGGVDSSFTAALLKREGHEVTGVTMKVWQDKDAACPTGLQAPDKSCCGAEAMGDARAVAGALDAPFYVLNYEDRFRQDVIEAWADEYLAGRTPNPCVACNDKVKFDPLLKTALGLGMDKLATGHYARVDQGPDGKYRLLRAVDRTKDQTYFLYRLGQAQLEKLIFPLGGMTKEQVRIESAAIQLPTATKPESMDICFVPQGDFTAVLEKLRPEAAKEGPVMDLEGRELGRHRGVAFYTIGQRKGLGIASEKPIYVVKLDRERNAVIVGGEQDLLSSRAALEKVSWVAGQAPDAPIRASVKIRSSHPGAMATLSVIEDGRAEVNFDEPQRAVTPGQAAVFYDGESCLGGGVLS